MLNRINLAIIIMFRLKTDTNISKVPHLQIKIPNFSHSQEKFPKSVRPVKSKSTAYQISKPYTQIIKSRTPKSKQSANNIIHSPNNLTSTQSKRIKTQWDSKSPKNRLNSPLNREINLKSIKETMQMNSNTSRNIDDIKKKLQAYKLPEKLNTRYFKKETYVNDKLNDMNKTLKKMADLRTRKPKYELKMIKQLGKSQTGVIILASSYVNNLVVVIKSFQKQKIKLEFMIEEMKIHLYCNHPHILPAYGYHIGRDEAYLVMEYGSHNLYQEILERGPFTQTKTAKYLTQIMSGIQYLHRHGIMHRDLKPENIICLGDHLKITDFGWSIKTDCQRKTLCGTLDYISPQVAHRNYYDNKIDCWSIGVLMYQMLMVHSPFVQEGQVYQFTDFKMPTHLTPQCKDLLIKLLEVKPQQRLSARQALQHPFITNNKKVIANAERKYRQLKNQLQMLFFPL